MKLQISKSITIHQSANRIYDVIADLKNWNIWSPWFHCEPSATTKTEGSARTVGQNQSWQGEVIGSGKMTTAKLDSNRSVHFKLEFITPWKSVADVTFTLRAVEPQLTEVNWSMASSLPIFLFFFKNMMTAYVGNDFDRGLKMLKELLETGSVASKSIYQGEKEFKKLYVIGKKTDCRIAELSTHIRHEFEQLDKMLKESRLLPPQEVLTLSHIHDIPKGVCQFTAGYGYESNAGLNVPAGYTMTEISSHKGLLVDHYGSYRNLGNPWSMVTAYQRGKKKKILKKVPSYEIYRTMPDKVPEKDIHTQIVMPIK